MPPQLPPASGLTVAAAPAAAAALATTAGDGKARRPGGPAVLDMPVRAGRRAAAAAAAAATDGTAPLPPMPYAVAAPPAAAAATLRGRRSASLDDRGRRHAYTAVPTEDHEHVTTRPEQQQQERDDDVERRSQQEQQQQQPAKASKLARLRRRVLSVQQLWIWPFTHYKPTNQVMLCYRTLFQDLRVRRANDDTLAARFRDELMPLRGWVHRRLPALLHINKAFIQGPAFGCPGIMTYLDARTRWLDAEVLAAQGEGARQVVVVAAGYDTRAYRLRAPGVSYFEVDLPAASERKRQLVDRTMPAEQFPRPTYIAADLSVVSFADALLGTTGNGNRTGYGGARNGDGKADGGGRDGNGAGGGGAGGGGAVAAFRHQSTTAISTCGSCSSDGGGGEGDGDGCEGDGGGCDAGGCGAPATARPAAAFGAAAGEGGGGAGGPRFDPRARTLFTVEGLLYYLPPDAVTRLLGSIRSVAAPGSRVAFDFLHHDVFSGERWEPGYETLRLTVRNKGEPKRSGLDPDPARLGAYLGSLGWRLTYLPPPREVAAAMYPSQRWSRLNPVLPPFYNFAVAEAV